MPPSSGSSKVFILKPGHLCEFRFECFPFYAEMMASPLQTHLFPSSESRLQPFLPRILSETRLGHRALLCKARSLKTDILFTGLHSRQEFLSFHEEELEVVQQLILVEAFTSWNKKKEVSWEICHCSFPDSVQFSRSVVSDSLRSHESQHARPPCPSPTPRVHPDSCPSSQ